MSERMRLTIRTIEELKPRASRYIAWDPANAGFGVRVSPHGVKSFVYAYRFNGVSRLLTIGSAPPLTLEQARVALAEAQAKVMLAKHQRHREAAKTRRENDVRDATYSRLEYPMVDMIRNQS